MISSDHGAASPSMSDWPAMSPDGRIVTDWSPDGRVLSIDGAPPRVVHSPDGEDVSEPWFEPRGGLNKAIVSSLVSKKMWLASAGLTTGWTAFASTTGYCQWVGRTALCEIGDREAIGDFVHAALAACHQTLLSMDAPGERPRMSRVDEGASRGRNVVSA